MTITPTLFKEVLLIKTVVHSDSRGSFSEHFSKKFIQKAVGHKIHFCQDNLSYSKKGVIRGLHYQLHPHFQSKLVSVIKGSVLDVVVDIRKGSPTFGQHITQELSDENKLQLFIPRGFAHGYITLSLDSVFLYKVDQYYHPESEGSIAPDDPSLKINWRIPKDKWIQSEKDQNHPLLQHAIIFDYEKNFYA
jgi:dTDP-4-dehydrorhamnose 3,5-epimerase